MTHSDAAQPLVVFFPPPYHHARRCSNCQFIFLSSFNWNTSPLPSEPKGFGLGGSRGDGERGDEGVSGRGGGTCTCGGEREIVS